LPSNQGTLFQKRKKGENAMNLFKDIPEEIQEEIFETIIQTGDFTLERIISKGHATPAGKWYDQKQHEWVMILAGSAVLLFEDGEEVKLQQGDHLVIPAHKRHRVLKTDAKQKTIWLALHYNAG
jgi:cupin 2 domain-containing protein